jgi:hypothetical protein
MASFATGTRFFWPHPGQARMTDEALMSDPLGMTAGRIPRKPALRKPEAEGGTGPSVRLSRWVYPSPAIRRHGDRPDGTLEALALRLTGR